MGGFTADNYIYGGINMSSLSFDKIKSKFIGRYVYWDNLAKCAQRNGAATDPAVYIVYSCVFFCISLS